MAPTRHLAISALALALSAGAAGAQADPAFTIDNGATIDEIVDLLDSPSFYERDAARSALTDHPGLSNERIYEVLRDEEASPDTRLALESVLLERYARNPIGAIGIRFNLNALDETRGMLVGSTVDGFPAVDLGQIKAGDVIAAIDGIPLADDPNPSTTVRTRVFSRVPGEMVPLTVIRSVDGEDRELRLKVTLGDSNRHEGSGLARDVIDESLRLRLERKAGRASGRTAEMPTGEGFWPEPMARFPARMSTSSVVGGPSPLVNEINRLDPYAPRRMQEEIRNLFLQYSATLGRREAEAMLNADDDAVRKIIVQQGQQQVRIQMNQVQINQRVRMQNNAVRAHVVGMNAREIVPAQPGPLIDELVRLRDALQSLERTHAEAADPGAKARLGERIGETATRIDELQQELGQRLARLEAAEELRRQRRAADRQSGRIRALDR